MLSITVSVLYTALCKRGTTRQLAGAILSSVISALLLLPAQLWYNMRFNVEQTTISTLEIGFALFYVTLCGWICPAGVTVFYCLFTGPRDSNTAGRLPRQRKHTTRARAEAVSAQPPRRQPGVVAPFAYNADRPWGWLVYSNGNFAGQELALKRSIVSIGREEDNEVWLDDDTISRYHAELAWDQGQVYVTDNESLNGVLLNGQRIRTSLLVKAGDELEIGAHRFILKYAQQPAEELDDDVLLPQLRRSSSSRGGSHPSSPGNSRPSSPGNSHPSSPSNSRPSSPGNSRPSLPGTSDPEIRRPLAPTTALHSSQEESLHTAQTPLPLSGRASDIADQETTKFASTSLVPQTGTGGLCVILNGEMSGHNFLLDRPVLFVGRDVANDVVILDLSVSRRHAQFSHLADGDYVQDLTSTHGSQVNGIPLHAPRRLFQGDVITLGEVLIEYTLLPETQASQMPFSLSPTPFNFPPPMRLPSK